MHQEIKSNRVSDLRCAVAASPGNAAHRHLAWNKVVRAADGTVILAYLGGERHGGRKGLYIHTSSDDGETFSPARLLWWGDDSYPNLGNAALGVTPLGSVVVIAMGHCGQRPNVVSTIRGWRSTDHAQSFSPIDTSRLDGTVRSVFGRIQEVPGKGLLVLGFNTPDSKGMDETALWRAYSGDDGLSWSDPKLVTDQSAPMVEPSVLWTGERLAGIGRHHGKSAGPVFGADEAFYWHIASDDGGESFTAERTPMVVGRTGAPYMTQANGVLYSVVTDRAARTDDGRHAWTFTLWRNERGDAQSWEKIDDLLSVYDEKGETKLDFGYPWGVALSDDEERIYFYLGTARDVSSIYSFRLRFS